jgi:hypothetical protein
MCIKLCIAGALQMGKKFGIRFFRIVYLHQTKGKYLMQNQPLSRSFGEG